MRKHSEIKIVDSSGNHELTVELAIEDGVYNEHSNEWTPPVFFARGLPREFMEYIDPSSWDRVWRDKPTKRHLNDRVKWPKADNPQKLIDFVRSKWDTFNATEVECIPYIFLKMGASPYYVNEVKAQQGINPNDYHANREWNKLSKLNFGKEMDHFPKADPN